MKTVFLTLSVIIIGLLSSCSNSSADTNLLSPDGDMLEWTLEVQLPDDMATRAAASLAKGSDGLYSFTREINKLWYAVYYKDQYVFDINSAGATQPAKIDNKFYLIFKFPKLYDPTQLKVFLWAGNAEDNVSTDDVTSVSNGINLNFINRCVSIDPKYINGGSTDIAECDSFYGYYQLSDTNNPTDFNLKFTLKRPFAQIHVLTNEMVNADTKDAFPSGIIAGMGVGGADEVSSSNLNQNYVLPTTWFYDNSVTLNPAYNKGDFIYTQSNYEYATSMGSDFPELTRFKNKDYHYLGCMLTFAIPNDGQFSKLNMSVRNGDETIGSSDFVSVNLPESGIVSNYRYVVYNDNTGTASDNPRPGFFTENFSFECIVDFPYWNDYGENL